MNYLTINDVFHVVDKITATTVRENRGSISLTDDGGIELRNNLNDCLSVKLCDEFFTFEIEIRFMCLVLSVKIVLGFIVCILVLTLNI